MDKIDDCPFCGGSTVHLSGCSRFYVHCDQCEADGPIRQENFGNDIDLAKQKAIEEWNKCARQSAAISEKSKEIVKLNEEIARLKEIVYELSPEIGQLLIDASEKVDRAKW